MRNNKSKKCIGLLLAFLMAFGATGCFGAPTNGGGSSSLGGGDSSQSSFKDSSVMQESSSVGNSEENTSEENSSAENSSSDNNSADNNSADSSADDSSTSEEQLFFENGMPNYDLHPAEELIFNAWFSPIVNREAFELYKDCGFSHIFLMGNNVGYIGLDSSNKPTFLEKIDTALTYCDELGIKAYLDVSDCALNGHSASVGKNGVLAVLEQYKNHPSFVGTCYDEPVINTNTLNKRWGVVEMSPVVQAMATQYTAKEFMINSNPSTNCGYPWGTSAFTYEEYLEAHINSINTHYKNTTTKNWLSADDYPLYVDSAGNKFLKEEWLECMAYLAVFKRDKTEMNLQTNFFLQSTPFESNRQFMRDRTPTYNDLRLQLYTLMAFGYDSLSFFTYGTPPAEGDFNQTQLGLVDREGNPTETYTNSKKVIKEIKTFANTYMHFNDGWVGAHTIIGSNNTANSRIDFNNLNRIGNGTATKRMNSAKPNNTWFRQNGISYATATEDTVIGCMNDTWGNPGLMVVNYNDTSKNKSNTVDVQFSAAKYNKAWVYIDGVQNEVQLTNGKLTLQLDVGEGVFVIPIKKG